MFFAMGLFPFELIKSNGMIEQLKMKKDQYLTD
jgi:hypothetical protein